LGIKIETISPFKSEQEAKNFAKKKSAENMKELEGRWGNLQKKWFDQNEMSEFCEDIRNLSWDWTGRTGVIIAKPRGTGKSKKWLVISFAHNIVLPYESAMLHKGSLREKKHIPIGESQEIGETIHAELAAILEAQAKSVNLKECDLWTWVFPCPYCSRVVGYTSIKNVYYFDEYTNDQSYNMLKACGKKLVKIARE